MAPAKPSKRGITPANVRMRLGMSMRNLERLTRITAWTIRAYEQGEDVLSQGQKAYLDRVYRKLGELLEAVQ
jgi:DNA-binding transcriptional regulator YiaG